MAAINDLISQIQDVGLRDRIQKEVNKLSKQKKFGLVFEEHLPESTPLYDMPIKKGCNVMLRDSKTDKSVYIVVNVEGENAFCVKRDSQDEAITLAIKDIVRIAEFGEPIYPYLKPMDSVCNAPDSDLWHTLIEADNYHALQLLEYLYAGKVDCIYIDPPYNTGARDWKYNNDYVDGNDSYRHSKWLSFMKKRIKLAKKLLNPKDSVMIVTIDEKEYHHLACLLEEVFTDAKIQMISSLINRHGTSRAKEFSRTNEYIFFVMIGDYTINSIDSAAYLSEGSGLHWHTLRRSTASNIRDAQHPNQFYPIYVDKRTNRVVKVGESLPIDIPIGSVETIDNCETVFPLREDGTEMMWSVVRDKFVDYLSKGYARVTKHTPEKPQKYVVQYLQSGVIEDIENGNIEITGKEDDGSVIGIYKTGKDSIPSTLWTYDYHDARDYGTKILKNTLGEIRFDFPKSLYAVRDCIKLFTKNKKNSLILDFFAGSGTTLHAVNLLNAEDGGKRRCIMVTNNEVSDAEAKELTKQGFKPGDEEWEKLGIARYVTWPRTVCSIEGHDIKGNPLKGSYIGSDIPMSDGFKANANFFKLGFLDKNEVALGKRFKELIPVLWMKAGAIGKCPKIQAENTEMIVFPENKFAILNDESAYLNFVIELENHPEIETVYIVTDSERAYMDMIQDMKDKKTYQLYRDYLDNFRINSNRR